MKKVAAIGLSVFLLGSSIPVRAAQPTDVAALAKPPVTIGQDKAKDQPKVDVTTVKPTQASNEQKQTQPSEQKQTGTPVLGARRNAMATFRLIEHQYSDSFGEDDTITLAVIADQSDLTVDELAARLTPTTGDKLTVDQLIADLKLDAQLINDQVAELDARIAAEEETVAPATTPTTDSTVTTTTDTTTTPTTDTTTTTTTDTTTTPATDSTTTTTEAQERADLQAKVTRYTEILAQQPDNRRFELKLARTYKELGQYTEAKAELDKLFAKDADDKLANIVAAQILAAQGQYDGAIAKYRAALAEDSQAPVQTELATTLDAAGQTTEAATAMDQAAAQDQDTQTVEKAAKLHRKAGDKDILVYVHGQRPNMDVPPVIKEGRTLIPFRALAEALQATVNWDEATKTVTMERNGHVVTLTIDSLTATLDGQELKLDVAAQLSNNRTMVPLRFLAKALESNVDWWADTETVVVTPTAPADTTTTAGTTTPTTDTTTTAGTTTPTTDTTTTTGTTTPAADTTTAGTTTPATDTTLTTTAPAADTTATASNPA